MAIVLRTTKGSPLTHAELDNNFTELIAAAIIPAVGIAGTYRSVTTNAQGQVIAGTNPTTLAGYGITNAVSLTGVGASGNWSINAATATNVAYSGLTGTVPTWNQNTTGNAATATNVAYSGLTGTVPTWNQNTTGNAATATTATNLSGGMITGNYTLSDGTSPNTPYFLFGDNTSWTYRFMTSVAGTPTMRFSFTDQGNFTATGTITETSTRKAKKNIRPITGALNSVLALNGVKYDLKDDTAQNQLGLIAEDVFAVEPALVTIDDLGEATGVQYSRVVALLIEGIKEQEARIKHLENVISGNV